MLKPGEGESVFTKCLHEIHNPVDNDVLASWKAESGWLEIERAPFDLNELVEAGSRVLLVHPEGLTREALRERLESWQARCNCVSTGTEGLRALDMARRIGYRFDVILVSTRLDDMAAPDFGRHANRSLNGARLALLAATPDFAPLPGEPGFARTFFMPVSSSSLEAMRNGCAATALLRDREALLPQGPASKLPSRPVVSPCDDPQVQHVMRLTSPPQARLRKSVDWADERRMGARVSPWVPLRPTPNSK